MLDILEAVEKWLTQGQQVALATVVSTWGSSPRQMGAKLAVTPDMAMVGSVSGGCVETAVVQEAIDGLTDRKLRLLHFGVSDNTAWEVGLACGGKIDIYVEPLDLVWWKLAAERVRQHQPFTTVTVIDGPEELKGRKAVLDEEGHVLYTTPDLPITLQQALVAAAQTAAGRSQRQQVTTADQTCDVLIEAYQPEPRLLIVGGSHIAVALAKYAKVLGWRVFLCDPRKVFAAQERFPEVDMISHSYPDKALVQFGLGAESYVAVLTHDPKIDDPALKVALPSPAPYVGVFSGHRTHQQRVERLTKAGMPSHLLDRVHVPIGLDIGAKTPEEIALCIMAEIVAVRNGAVEKKAAVPQPAAK